MRFMRICYIICYVCATIRNEIYHKYGDNPLTLCYGEKGVDDTYWCEVCEGKVDPREWFYTNSKKCTTIYHQRIFGVYAYLKSGHIFEHYTEDVEVVCHSSSSRPKCHTCHKYCQHPVYFKTMLNGTQVDICSLHCHDIYG